MLRWYNFRKGCSKARTHFSGDVQRHVRRSLHIARPASRVLYLDRGRICCARVGLPERRLAREAGRKRGNHPSQGRTQTANRQPQSVGGFVGRSPFCRLPRGEWSCSAGINPTELQDNIVYYSNRLTRLCRARATPRELFHPAIVVACAPVCCCSFATASSPHEQRVSRAELAPF
jgi:hypothetical protein